MEPDEHLTSQQANSAGPNELIGVDDHLRPTNVLINV